LRAVTTFSPEGYEKYGRKCLETFVKHWPIPIEVWYEEKPDFEHEKIIYRPIDGIEDRKKFLEIAKTVPGSDGTAQGTYNFHYDAIKFCHKVFCQLETEDDLVYWVDADTVTHKDVPKEMLEGLLKDHPYCFFGRGTFTETGFLGFNKKSHLYEFFKYQYRRVYMEKIIFRLLGWHDCFAFDFARIGIQGNNLSPLGTGTEHVIAMSFMAEYIDHLKGNRKKRGHSPESIVKWW